MQAQELLHAAGIVYSNVLMVIECGILLVSENNTDTFSSTCFRETPEGSETAVPGVRQGITA